MTKKALIIMDMQYDFCDGGPMANTNSLQIIPKINSISDNYNLVIFVMKTHNSDNTSFKLFGGQHPPHCIKNTYGSQLHNDLIISSTSIQISVCNSSSAFYYDENTETPTQLKYFLQVNSIKTLHFCGNNMDTSIFSTIIDALNYNFTCHILGDIIGYQNEAQFTKHKNFLTTLGVQIN